MEVLRTAATVGVSISDEVISSQIPRTDGAGKSIFEVDLAKGKDSPFKGRPPSIDSADVKAAVAKHGSKAAAAKALGISRDSVYRVLRKPVRAAS